MIKRTKVTTEISIIYQFGEGKKAAAEVNELKKLHGFTCIFFKKAKEEENGSYIMRYIETDSETTTEPIRVRKKIVQKNH